MVEMRVASFNIRNGRAFDWFDSWPFRARALAGAIDGLGADVLGLQEVYAFQLRWLQRRLPRYEAAGLGRNRGNRGERCPVLVDRRRVRLLDHVTRWYGDVEGGRLPGAAYPRIATTCRVEVDGTELVVTSTHLDSRSPELRRRSAEQLVGWLDDAVPNVVLGDFNAGPTSTVLAPLLDAGLRHALPADAGGTAHGFTGRTDGSRIDHILVTADIEVRRAEVVHARPGGRLPSDHWPVVADLRVTSASRPSRNRRSASLPTSASASE